MVVGVWRRLSFVVVCNTARRRICNVTYQGAASDGGPVVLRPVRATPSLLSHVGIKCNEKQTKLPSLREIKQFFEYLSYIQT